MTCHLTRLGEATPHHQMAALLAHLQIVHHGVDKSEVSLHSVKQFRAPVQANKLTAGILVKGTPIELMFNHSYALSLHSNCASIRVAELILGASVE